MNVETEKLKQKIRKLYMKPKISTEDKKKLKKLLEELKQKSPVGAEAESLNMTMTEISRIRKQLEKERKND